jgi:hypothetical protein
MNRSQESEIIIQELQNERLSIFPFFALFGCFAGFPSGINPNEPFSCILTPEYFEYFYFSFSRLFGCFTGLSVRN